MLCILFSTRAHHLSTYVCRKMFFFIIKLNHIWLKCTFAGGNDKSSRWVSLVARSQSWLKHVGIIRSQQVNVSLENVISSRNVLSPLISTNFRWMINRHLIVCCSSAGNKTLTSKLKGFSLNPPLPCLTLVLSLPASPAPPLSINLLLFLPLRLYCTAVPHTLGY